METVAVYQNNQIVVLKVSNSQPYQNKRNSIVNPDMKFILKNNINNLKIEGGVLKFKTEEELKNNQDKVNFTAQDIVQGGKLKGDHIPTIAVAIFLLGVLLVVIGFLKT